MDSSLTTHHMTNCGIGIFFVELYLKLHVLNDFKKKKYKNKTKVHLQIRIYIRSWLTCEITNNKPMVSVALEERFVSKIQILNKN